MLSRTLLHSAWILSPGQLWSDFNVGFLLNDIPQFSKPIDWPWSIPWRQTCRASLTEYYMPYSSTNTSSISCLSETSANQGRTGWLTVVFTANIVSYISLWLCSQLCVVHILHLYVYIVHTICIYKTVSKLISPLLEGRKGEKEWKEKCVTTVWIWY